MTGFFVAGSDSGRSVRATGRQPILSVYFRRLLISIGLILLSVPALAASREPYPGLGRPWQHYQSPNFELYSANNDRESRDVLEQMELLRALFLDTFKLTVRMPQPVTIYYFAREADFDAYRPVQHQGSKVKFMGFCTNYPDRTVITLAPTRDREAARELVYHEYIHYLFRITEQNPAPWFNEGVAELFSTLYEDKQWLQMGRPVEGRVVDLRLGKMMPLEQLFTVRYDSPLFRDKGHTGIFYAQSWILLHFCRYGVNGIPPEKMQRFLQVAGSEHMHEHPEELAAVCRDLLGMDYAELLRQLERYVAYGRFMGRKVLRPKIADKSTYVVRPAPNDEVEVRLAELKLRMTDSPQANLLLRDRLERKPDIQLEELFGMVALKEDEADVARERWSRAVEMGTENVAIFRELARLEANAVFSQFDLDYRMPEKRAAHLRHLLKRSLEFAPEQSQGYEMLAWVEATADKPDIASVNLVQSRFASLNDKPRTLLALVMVRLRLGDTATAAQLLDLLDSVATNDWLRYCAELTRARLENRPVDRSRLPESSNRAGGIRMVAPRIDLPH